MKVGDTLAVAALNSVETLAFGHTCKHLMDHASGISAEMVSYLCTNAIGDSLERSSPMPGGSATGHFIQTIDIYC